MTSGSVSPRPRKAWAAALLSLATPGLGHLYAGRPRLALLALVFTQAAGFLSIILALGLASLGATAVVLPILVSLATLLLLLVHAYRTARRAPREYQLRPFNRWWIYAAAAAAFLALWKPAYVRIVTQYLAEAYQINSPAMEPTLLQGDFIIVTRLRSTRPPSHNECVIINQGSVTVVKRIVGLPGDTLAMRRGTLIRNGHEVREPWAQMSDTYGDSQPIQQGLTWHYAHLTSDTTGYRPTMRDWGPFVIPPDSIFLLGDNRDDSYDSRFYGALAASEVRGYPVLLYLSLAPPGGDGPRIRWRRIGTRPWVAA